MELLNFGESLYEIQDGDAGTRQWAAYIWRVHLMVLHLGSIRQHGVRFMLLKTQVKTYYF